MASLWRHPKSSFWTACFTDIHGCRRKRSTGVEVVPKLPGVTPAVLRKRAQAIADEFEAASRTQRSAAKVRAVLLELHNMVSGETVAQMTLAKAVEVWLARRESETAPATMAFYTPFTTRLTGVMGDRSTKDIARVTRQDIFDFRSARIKVVGASTANHEINGLRMFFAAAKREGWIAESPVEGVDAVRAPADAEQVERRPFTMPEVAALLDLANPEWQSMILCGLYTGQRMGDLCRLPWSAVDFAAGTVRLKTAKTGKRMLIPMAGPLRDGLAARRASMPDATLVHPTLAVSVAKSTGTVSSQFARLLTKAGLREEREKKGIGAMRLANDLSFHCFRHTAVTFLKAAGSHSAISCKASVNGRFLVMSRVL